FSETRTFAGSATYRLSNAATGLFEPSSAPGSSLAAAVLFKSDGYHLGVAPCCEAPNAIALRVDEYRTTQQGTVLSPPASDTSPSRRYSPWRTLVPRYWLPTIDPGISGGYRVGASTAAHDVVGRHALSASIAFPTNKTGIVGDLSYQYSGLGLPILQFDGAQSWESLQGI